MRRLLTLLFCLGTPAWAADDPGLAALSAKLAMVRVMPAAQTGYRGGSRALTEAKHLLRDWVESALPQIGPGGDPHALAATLNQRVRLLGLDCESDSDPQGERCEREGPGSFNARGYLADIALDPGSIPGTLVLITAVGIECGYDHSAYVYGWREGRWRRLFQSERDRYTRASYDPQDILQVLLAPGAATGRPPLVLTTGVSPWCSSNWQALYYRLWRAVPGDTSPKPLLDREEFSFLTDAGAKARLGADNVLIEYATNSVDRGNVTIRTAIRHFHLDAHDRVQRVGPYALNPRDAVDEWLTRPWAESSALTDPRAEARLRRWHMRLHRRDLSGEFLTDAGRCRSDPTLWQIAIALQVGEHGRPPLYFDIRWEQPYRFTLVGISARKEPGCDGPGMVDDKATLFPDPSPSPKLDR